MFATRQKPDYGGLGSIEVGPRVPGEAPVRRSTLAKNGLATTPVEGVNTVYDVLRYVARTYGNKPALGWRDVVDIVEEQKQVTKLVDGKEVSQTTTWKYFQLSGYTYISFAELYTIVHDIARGLADLGLQRSDILNIFAATSQHWQFVQHACMALGMTVATAYSTLGEAGLTHSLNEPEVAAVFTDADLLDIFARVLPNTPSVRLVVYSGEAAPAVLDKIRQTRHDVRIVTLDEVREAGRHSQTKIEHRAPQADDVALIMYTSGTTGPPKGVVLKHSNLVSAVAGVDLILGHHMEPDDTMLHYLPLAHVLEYLVELSFMFLGITAGFGRVKTLTDASVRNCKGDLAEFRPSLLAAVPAVWETIRKGILDQVNKAGTFKKTVFNTSVRAKRASIPGISQLLDNTVFKVVKEKTGGRLRMTMSGGAALSKVTQEFLSTTLVDILQGYGMTESCGMCAFLPPEFFQLGVAGAPVPCVEIKLIDVPDAGYLSTNPLPQGEILIRGPVVTSGYYKRPDLNNDPTIFDPPEKGGWLHTGDIGQWNKDGTLSLIDRVKNLVKLQNGEYVALEQLEAIYRSAPVSATIAVIANGGVRQPIAVVVPHEAHLRAALGLSANGKDLRELCATPGAAEVVLAECNRAGKAQGLKGAEMLSAVVLTADEWTPESGLVTAAMKLQRRHIEARYAEEIKAAFKSSQGID
ncbi:long-chain-fatty-acid-CoA-ligase [Exidia glandulosa HHB12029]|uniref:Long-chain-fatty-acid-CoA-ligase n=1 Tax=Exidia glandulosa HHB12029 TaxID=1314781 RepID=A0A165FJ44_EXIGL|nr:long-chain-fatty-acid-CoA-ligase [Exidia glandulosa HHB12029]